MEGLHCYPNLSAALSEHPHLDRCSIITQPEVTEEIVEDAIATASGCDGIGHLWMQPGAESAKAIRRAREAGLTVIAGGPCVLVELG